MQRKIIETADGSKTIYLEEWDENYHSHNGALQEAKHVFIDKVRAHIGNKKEITILEMGFGTGLNAFLSLELALELKIKINYLGLEAFPVRKEELDVLEYENIWPEGAVFYKQMHTDPWNESTEIHPLFHLTKQHITFEEWESQQETFDFIYYDVFGPRVQPHLWTLPIFQKMYDSAKSDGILLTYCAKGQVRRDFQSLGFEMSRLPGPPGKREMLMGVK